MQALRILYGYARQKVTFASLLATQEHKAAAIITPEEYWYNSVRNLFQKKMTYLFDHKGVEMAPTLSDLDKLVVRKLLWDNEESMKHHEKINVGDVVVLKDPEDSNNYSVRRLVAVSGDEMVSTKEDDEPFVIEDGHCWVVSDNEELKPEERKDSRVYGPISMEGIVGRVIYRYQNIKDHGFIKNNTLSLSRDIPVLYFELPEFKFNVSSETRADDEDSEDSK